MDRIEQGLFQTKTFVFMVKRHMEKFEAIITKAGGKCINLQGTKVTKKLLQDRNHIPVRYEYGASVTSNQWSISLNQLVDEWWMNEKSIGPWWVIRFKTIAIQTRTPLFDQNSFVTYVWKPLLWVKLWKYIKHASTKVLFYHCKICQRAFTYRRSLRLYKQRFHGQNESEFSCKLCSMKFINKQRLILHMTFKHGLSKFKCNICSFSTKYVQNLAIHKRNKHFQMTRENVHN